MQSGIGTDEESADPNSVATLRYLTDVKQIDILKSGNVPVTPCLLSQEQQVTANANADMNNIFSFMIN